MIERGDKVIFFDVEWEVKAVGTRSAQIERTEEDDEVIFLVVPVEVLERARKRWLDVYGEVHLAIPMPIAHGLFAVACASQFDGVEYLRWLRDALMEEVPDRVSGTPHG